MKSTTFTLVLAWRCLRDTRRYALELRASRDEWVKTGAQAKLERCGPKARPCVRVDERAGVFGTASDHRVLLGY